MQCTLSIAFTTDKMQYLFLTKTPSQSAVFRLNVEIMLNKSMFCIAFVFNGIENNY